MGVYERLGVRRVINAAGTLTMLGGSVLSREVCEAMDEAATSFVLMEELHDRAGEIVAEITGAEAGFVTAGCAAALVLASAACMTGGDEAKMRLLPRTEGMRNEVIIQRFHRNAYDYLFTIPGARLVEVGSLEGTRLEEVEEAINERTAAIAYVQAFWLPEKPMPSLEEVAALAKRHRFPLIVDAAAELPPVENLRKFIAMGADLVAFSGGKAIQGPNDSGFISGRRDLIRACRALVNLDASRGILLGRPSKISKEQVVGFIVALQRYVAKNHEAELKAWEARVAYIVEQMGRQPGVKAERLYPRPNRPIPHATITLDEDALGMTASEVVEALKAGSPAVWVERHRAPSNGLIVDPTTLLEGDEVLLVERLKQVLAGKA